MPCLRLGVVHIARIEGGQSVGQRIREIFQFLIERLQIWRFHEVSIAMGVPQNLRYLWLIIKFPVFLDDSGVPLFLDTTTWILGMCETQEMGWGKVQAATGK